MDAAEARTAAKRMAAKLERAEATIGTLRGERRELKAAGDRLADELVAAERLLERARAEAERAPEVVDRARAGARGGASCAPRRPRRRAIAARPPRPSCAPPAPSASCARPWPRCAARRGGSPPPSSPSCG